ncbi:MAG: hypothetical protein IJ738_04990, partial [Alphaproteobacteria bacterium]|nr:hypothetical protein [Alphaproteobacteria bacterium]
MRKFALILGLCLWSLAAVAEKIAIAEISDAEYYEHIKKSVKKFKDLIKTNNPQLIAQNVVYPYSLGWGVPSVHNEQ